MTDLSKLTAASVSAMTGPELVETFNAAATLLGLEAVKKFSDRKSGAARVMKILGDAQLKLATTEPSAKKAKKSTGAPKGETIAGYIKGLIADGKTNEEIWALAQPKFGMPDGHKHYPQWYRRQAAKG